MKISFSDNIQQTDQRLVVDRNSVNQANVAEIRPPRGWETAKRKLLNVFTFGLYNRAVENPRQWNAFRDAILSDLVSQGKTGHTEIQPQWVEGLLATYNHNHKLTKTKAANVLADVEAYQSGAGERLHERSAKAIDASQNVVARGLRTLYERGRHLRKEESALLEQARTNGVGASKKAAVERILRPGRTISSTEIVLGQEAIWKKAQELGVAFEYSKVGVQTWDSVEGILSSVVDTGGENIANLRKAASEGKPAILSIPIGLKDTSFGLKENHVVEVAVDFRNRRILYLDSKALPLDHMGNKYGKAGNVRQALENFGRQLFGAGTQSWDQKAGVLEFALAKQQGANDCGAFTHYFTHKLVEGKSVGDLERTFTSAERGALRMEMAATILNNDHNEGDMLHCVPDATIMPIGIKSDSESGSTETGNVEDGAFENLILQE